MKKFAMIGATVMLALPLTAEARHEIIAPQSQLGVSADLQMQVQDSFIFVFDDSVASGQVGSMANAMASQSGGNVRHVYSNSIRGFSANMPHAAAERLVANNPNIAYYEPDGVVFASMPCGVGPFPPCEDDGGGDDGGSGQETPWGITRVNGGVDGTGLNAWIIDTGIDLDHPDLNVDVNRSVNLVSSGSDNGGDDGNGHGTHVAGTVGAIDNDIGVIGVAANANVIAVRVLDNNGSGSFSDVIAGVDHVAANGAPGDVANMSLGGGFSQSVNDAVAAAADQGIIFSLAAGNSSDDANDSSPASTEHPNVYTVSAMDDTDTFASFSNFGNPPIECAAPGVDVLSTYNDGGTRFLSGTSMSAPHVAGLILITNASVNFDGNVSGDPDGNPDPICVN